MSELFPLAMYSLPLIPHFDCLSCDLAHVDGINPEKVGFSTIFPPSGKGK